MASKSRGQAMSYKGKRLLHRDWTRHQQWTLRTHSARLGPASEHQILFHREHSTSLLITTTYPIEETLMLGEWSSSPNMSSTHLFRLPSLASLAYSSSSALSSEVRKMHRSHRTLTLIYQSLATCGDYGLSGPAILLNSRRFSSSELLIPFNLRIVSSC